MDDSRAEFDAHDAELIATALRETEVAEAAALVEAGIPPAEAEEVAAEPAPAPKPAPAAAPAPAEPATVSESEKSDQEKQAVDAQGNTKAALRAARHEAKRLREENEALRKRIEEGGSAEKPDPTALDDSQLNDVREYAPAVGTAFDALRAENAELKKRVSASPAAKQEFVPELMLDEVQAGIDDIPELLQWQISPEHQDKWTAVKAADTYLMRSPRFEGRSYAERFAAAVAMVKEQFAGPSKSTPTPKTLAEARRVIAAAAARPQTALTVGDLRGGAPASDSIPDYHAMAKAGMSDEEIIASLSASP